MSAIRWTITQPTKLERAIKLKTAKVAPNIGRLAINRVARLRRRQAVAMFEVRLK
jgi:hypothetical protein